MDNGLPAGNRFVGRQREMAELSAVLEDALAGHGRVVMLAGEPGSGKTLLARCFSLVALGKLLLELTF